LQIGKHNKVSKCRCGKGEETQWFGGWLELQIRDEATALTSMAFAGADRDADGGPPGRRTGHEDGE